MATVFDSGSPHPQGLFYLDGAYIGTSVPTPANGYGSTWQLVLGAQGNIGYSSFLRAEVDEVRLSSVARYTSNFVPQTRFSVDSDTMRLWHFDEASGAVAQDASGNGRHFSLNGGYSWVRGVPPVGPAASYRVCGSPCAGSTTPQLGFTGMPVMGHSFQIHGTNLPPFQLAILTFGFGNRFAGMPLPIDLGVIGLPGCDVWTSSDLDIPFNTGLGGQISYTMSPPTSPGLLNLRFRNQVIARDTGSGANWLGVVLSDAGEGVIGY